MFFGYIARSERIGPLQWNCWRILLLSHESGARPRLIEKFITSCKIQFWMSQKSFAVWTFLKMNFHTHLNIFWNFFLKAIKNFEKSSTKLFKI